MFRYWYFLLHSFLKFIELFTGLSVKVFSIYHKQTFFYIGIVFKKGRSLERCQRFAASCGVPDVAVATVLLDAINNRFHRINLIRSHNEQLLLTFYQNHILANHTAQSAFGQEFFREGFKVRYFLIVLVC